MQKKICRERNVDYLCNPKRKVRVLEAMYDDEITRKYFEICDLFRGEFEKNERGWRELPHGNDRLTMRCTTMKSPERNTKKWCHSSVGRAKD